MAFMPKKAPASMNSRRRPTTPAMVLPSYWPSPSSSALSAMASIEMSVYAPLRATCVWLWERVVARRQARSAAPHQLGVSTCRTVAYILCALEGRSYGEALLPPLHTLQPFTS